MFRSQANLVRTAFLLLVASLGMTTTDGTAALNDDSGAEADWSELSTNMETMHRSMAAVHPSKDSDRNFVNLMLPHHRAAIDMAKAQLKYGNDPQMRRLAQEILTDQQSEIELMNLWLKRHDSARNPESK